MGAIQILLTWVIAVPIVIALGVLPARLAGATGPMLVRASLWCGLAVLTVIVTLINLWLPLRGWGASLIVIAAAAAALLAGGTGLASRARHGWRAPGGVTAAAASGAVALLAVGSSLTPTHYDFGLYHFSMIRFAADFPAIPGIANVLSYFGYANTEFPLAAFFTNGLAGTDGYRGLNGLVAVLLVLDLVLRVCTRRASAGTPTAAVGVVVCVLPLLALADWMLASPSSDTAVFILCLASTASLADALGRGRVVPTHVLIVLVPLLVAASMRPQMLLVFACSVAVLIAVDRRDGSGRGMRGTVLLLAGLSIGFLIAQLSRDYVLTGRAFYPLSLWTFDVPWLADDPAVLRSITVGIARNPGPGYQEAATGYAWLPDWIVRQPRQWEFWLFALLVVVGIVALVIARRRRTLQLRRLALLIAPSVVFMCAWILVLPPTWRLALGPGFSIGAGLVGWAAYRARTDPRVLARWALLTTVVLGLAAAIVRYPTKPDSMPIVEVTELAVAPGLTLLVPVGTDQCWESGLLCTSVPDERLRPLGPSLADGFRLER